MSISEAAFYRALAEAANMSANEWRTRAERLEGALREIHAELETYFQEGDEADWRICGYWAERLAKYLPGAAPQGRAPNTCDDGAPNSERRNTNCFYFDVMEDGRAVTCGNEATAHCPSCGPECDAHRCRQARPPQGREGP